MNEEFNKKNNELAQIKRKLNKNILALDKENIILNIISFDENINYPILCKKTDTINKIEEELYYKYPEYRNSNNYFLFNNQKLNKYRSLEENNIKEGSVIILYC